MGSRSEKSDTRISTGNAPNETPGSWTTDAAGNWIFAVNGISYKNIWIVSNGRWYYLDENGNPMMGWQTLNGVQYFFSSGEQTSHPFGSLYINEITPDGISVNSTGARNS